MKKFIIAFVAIISVGSAYGLNLNSEVGRNALDTGVKECVNVAMEKSGYRLYGMLFNQQERQLYTKLCTCAMRKTLSKMSVNDLIAIGMEESPALEEKYQKIAEDNMMECIKEYNE